VAGRLSMMTHRRARGTEPASARHTAKRFGIDVAIHADTSATTKFDRYIAAL
jgi:hypothetical protein